MKSLILALVLLPICAFAQNTSKIVFTDKSGEMVLDNISSISTRLTGQDMIHFRAVGHKLHGSWASLKMSLTAEAIEGDARRSSTGLMLQGATVSGGVHLTMNRGLQVITADSKSAVVTSSGDKMHVDMDGGVVIDSRNASAGESVHATGSTGSVTVSQANGMGNATLTDPVKVDMTRRLQGGAPAHLVARSKRLDINREASPATITLTGDVSIQGNDPALAGDLRAGKVIITLDDKGQPVGMDATGEPGVTRIKKRGRGGA